MAGEDQERFEDYLELDHYIEELRAGHIAHPPRGLTPSGHTSIGWWRFFGLLQPKKTSLVAHLQRCRHACNKNCGTRHKQRVSLSPPASHRIPPGQGALLSRAVPWYGMVPSPPLRLWLVSASEPPLSARRARLRVRRRQPVERLSPLCPRGKEAGWPLRSWLTWERT